MMTTNLTTPAIIDLSIVTFIAAVGVSVFFKPEWFAALKHVPEQYRAIARYVFFIGSLLMLALHVYGALTGQIVFARIKS